MSFDKRRDRLAPDRACTMLNHVASKNPHNTIRGELMDITGLLIFLAIGAVAGWLGSTIMKGGGFGLIGNIVVGIVGAMIGGFVFNLMGIAAGGLIGSIITATVGAIILLFIVGLIKKA
jgi:uncharacterized membrane protein YeaQ/YmgE (transglycosylase-associated protein family)